jgi:hypothetical protein
MFPEIIIKAHPDWSREARVVTEALDAGNRDGLNETMEALKEKAQRLASRRVRKFSGAYHSSFRVVRARKRGDKTSSKLVNDAPDASVVETGRPAGSTPMPHAVMDRYLEGIGAFTQDIVRPVTVTIKRKRGGSYTKTKNVKLTREMRVARAVKVNAARGNTSKLGGTRGRGAWIFRDIAKEFNKSEFRNKLVEHQTKALRRKGKVR